MIPLGAVLGVSLEKRDASLDETVSTSVAAVVSLVPEGLMVLASLTYAVAALRMSRRGALAQQLNAIESLAAVDVICTDKTGTLTEAALRVVEVVPAPGIQADELTRALGVYAASTPARNGTLEAVAAEFPAEAVEIDGEVPFSSGRRWSALALAERTYVLGAPAAAAARNPGRAGGEGAAQRAARAWFRGLGSGADARRTRNPASRPGAARSAGARRAVASRCACDRGILPRAGRRAEGPVR
jgi:cation transport ATPase